MPKLIDLLWPFLKWQILGSTKLKDFLVDNSKFDKNGVKFFKWVENTWKRRNFSFSHSIFKTFTADTNKQELVWERVKFCLLDMTDQTKYSAIMSHTHSNVWTNISIHVQICWKMIGLTLTSWPKLLISACFSIHLTFYNTIPPFNNPRKEDF